jgi:hypothetical protein
MVVPTCSVAKGPLKFTLNYFPTRIQNNSVTALNNIFIDISKFEDYIISPPVNGLACHDAQLIMINDKFKNSE